MRDETSELGGTDETSELDGTDGRKLSDMMIFAGLILLLSWLVRGFWLCVSAVCATRLCLVGFFVVGLGCFCGFCCVRRRFLRSLLCGWYTLGPRGFFFGLPCSRGGVADLASGLGLATMAAPKSSY